MFWDDDAGEGPVRVKSARESLRAIKKVSKERVIIREGLGQGRRSPWTGVGILIEGEDKVTLSTQNERREEGGQGFRNGRLRV